MNLDAPQALTLQLRPYSHARITLVGCGGTGSHIASGLAALAGQLADRAVTCDLIFIDPDTVEPKNVGRQLFSHHDVGQNKAEVLAWRLSAAYGLAIAARPEAVTAAHLAVDMRGLNLVVGAVDNAAARAVIAGAVAQSNGHLWALDCGNENHSGQVALGNSPRRVKPALGMVDALPSPYVVYPDLVKAPKKARRTAASCAELTASGEQGLMVNRMAAAWALAMLHDFLAGKLKYFALDFDLGWGGVRSRVIDAPTLAGVQQ